PAAEDHHRELGRVLALAEPEPDAHRRPDERHRKAGREAEVLEAEDADGDVRQPAREAGSDPVGGDVDRRGGAEGVQRAQPAKAGGPAKLTPWSRRRTSMPGSLPGRVLNWTCSKPSRTASRSSPKSSSDAVTVTSGSPAPDDARASTATTRPPPGPRLRGAGW